MAYLALTPPSDQYCYFWRMPQEIQDMIFKFAYLQQEDLNIHFTDEWDRTEKNHKKCDRDGYNVRPFPAHKVNEFIVSKRFFIGAARAWVLAQRWEDCSPYQQRPRCEVRRFVTEPIGLFLPFAQDVALPHVYLDTVDNIDDLRRLKVQVNERASEDVEEKDAWEDVLEAHELQRLPIVSDLDSLRGLVEFSIVSSGCSYANTVAKTKTFGDNV